MKLLILLLLISLNCLGQQDCDYKEKYLALLHLSHFMKNDEKVIKKEGREVFNKVVKEFIKSNSDTHGEPLYLGLDTSYARFPNTVNLPPEHIVLLNDSIFNDPPKYYTYPSKTDTVKPKVKTSKIKQKPSPKMNQPRYDTSLEFKDNGDVILKVKGKKPKKLKPSNKSIRINNADEVIIGGN